MHRPQHLKAIAADGVRHYMKQVPCHIFYYDNQATKHLLIMFRTPFTSLQGKNVTIPIFPHQF